MSENFEINTISNTEELDMIAEKIVLEEMDKNIQGFVFDAYEEMKNQNLKSGIVFKRKNSIMEINIKIGEDGDEGIFYVNNEIQNHLFIDIKSKFIIIRNKENTECLYKIPLLFN